MDRVCYDSRLISAHVNQEDDEELFLLASKRIESKMRDLKEFGKFWHGGLASQGWAHLEDYTDSDLILEHFLETYQTCNLNNEQIIEQHNKLVEWLLDNARAKLMEEEIELIKAEFEESKYGI